MKLGRWGWGLKRLSLARFQRNRTMGFGESAKKWVAEAFFLRHVVSCSRKVSIKGSNFPKNRLFRVQNGTMFVPRLRVTDAEASFHTLQDIPQIYPSWVTFAEGCISSCPRPNVFESCATVSAMAERVCLYFFQTERPGSATIGSPSNGYVSDL